jgi:AcrR family transcriptional regulator
MMSMTTKVALTTSVGKLTGVQTRRYHHGDLRAALLDGAQQMLRERGAEALSLRELAREIGVSHAAPSRHFKDKRALLDAVAVAGFERLGEVLEQALAAGGDFTAKLHAAARTYVNFAVSDAALLDVMYASKHAPDVSDELRAASQRLFGPLLALITEGQQAGQVRDGDLERTGLVIFTGLHGFASMRASGMLPDEGADDALNALVDDLARAVRPA